MQKRKKEDERGFTLMELMVVIVIVAILAAVAVPLYINYVKDAQRTEAKGAIGAIVSAEQVHYQRTGGVGPATYADLPTLKTAKEVDLTEAEAKWNFNITLNPTDTSYVVTATNLADTSLAVSYSYKRSSGGNFTP
jgi:prepilin-type N-terminal cleavage/methylation domain-containing protein